MNVFEVLLSHHDTQNEVFKLNIHIKISYNLQMYNLINI